MIDKSQIGMNIYSWLLASLIFDSMWPLKNKLFAYEPSKALYFSNCVFLCCNHAVIMSS